MFYMFIFWFNNNSIKEAQKFKLINSGIISHICLVCKIPIIEKRKKKSIQKMLDKSFT